MVGPPGASWRQGTCLRYVVPAGWQVAEDGWFAVALVPPDRLAITTVVGHAGVPLGVAPGQFVYDKLSQTGLGHLRLGPPRPAPPVFGFPHAWAFDAEYAVSGMPCRGVARCSAAPAYDSVTLVLTWAASVVDQWPHYQGWLPQVAASVEVTDARAFGAAGVAAQNLQNSLALGEAARRDRAHSAALWGAVDAGRDASATQRQADFRDALGGTERYRNPTDDRVLDLPSGNTAYWVHPVTGRIVGSPDPAFDPRDATDASWLPLPRARPPG